MVVYVIKRLHTEPLEVPWLVSISVCRHLHNLKYRLKSLEMVSGAPTNTGKHVRQTLRVRVASETQKIQSSDWPK